MEPKCAVTSQAGLTDLQAGFNKLDVPVLKGVVNNPLVFLNRDGARGVPKG
jgi:hypothetical protein